jgi:hypothetical protein
MVASSIFSVGLGAPLLLALWCLATAVLGEKTAFFKSVSRSSIYSSPGLGLRVSDVMLMIYGG